MNGATYLIIGLIAGLALGLLIGALRIKAEREKVVAEGGKVALLNTQLEAMREEENRLTTLNEQLRAVTTGSFSTTASRKRSNGNFESMKISLPPGTAILTSGLEISVPVVR